VLDISLLLFYFSQSSVGAVFLAVLLAGIPGSKLGSFLTTRLAGGPRASVLLCNACFIGATALAAGTFIQSRFYSLVSSSFLITQQHHHHSLTFVLSPCSLCVSVVLKGPENQNLTVCFGVLWGACLGWQQPTHTAAFVPLMTPGQETELMGMYILSGQILSWLPPTVFTILNELGVPMAYGLGSLCLYFAVSMVFLWILGDYDDAVLAVQQQPLSSPVTMAATCDFEIMMVSPKDNDDGFDGDDDDDIHHRPQHLVPTTSLDDEVTSLPAPPPSAALEMKNGGGGHWG